MLAAALLSWMFFWNQPTGAVTHLAVPTRGGVLTLDTKRQVDEVTWITVDVRVNDYFKKYPDDHLYFMADADLGHDGRLYAGRGLFWGRYGDCFGLAIENFKTAQLSPCVPFKAVPWRWYEIQLFITATRVVAVVDGQVLYADVEDPTVGRVVSNTVFGALTDFTPHPPERKPPAVISYREIMQARYKLN